MKPAAEPVMTLKSAMRRPAGLADSDRRQALSRHLWQQFRDDNCFEAASALSYTTLLALVPLMAVVLGVVSAFPVFDHWIAELQNFVFQYFIPTVGDAIRDYLQQFVGRTVGLTGGGTLFLIMAAILMMATIEQSFNRIWRVRSARRPVNRLLMYWAVLTLGPLLMGGSLAMTSDLYLSALPWFSPELDSGVQNLFWLLAPFLMSVLAFTLLFVAVPNRRVYWLHALAGALLTAILFELSKRGFVFYVTAFPTYERLYGALATIPLFLAWVYISWVVILLGASLAAALTTFHYHRGGWSWSTRHDLLLALRLLGHFHQAQGRGEGLSSNDLLVREPAVSDVQLQQILGKLQQAGLIRRHEDEGWLLAADLDDISLDVLYRSADYVLPVTELDGIPREQHGDQALVEALQTLHRQNRPLFDRTLKSYLLGGEPPASG